MQIRPAAESGSMSKSVLAIARDQSGFMWFGTRSGLVRYDGVQLKYASLKKGEKQVPIFEYVTTICSAPAHGLWVSGAEVFMRYNSKRGYFENVLIDFSRSIRI